MGDPRRKWQGTTNDRLCVPDKAIARYRERSGAHNTYGEAESHLRHHLCEALDGNRRLPIAVQKDDGAFVIEIPVPTKETPVYAVLAKGDPGRRYEWVTKTVLTKEQYERTQASEAHRAPTTLSQLGTLIDAIDAEELQQLQQGVDGTRPAKPPAPIKPLLLVRYPHKSGEPQEVEIVEEDLQAVVLDLVYKQDVPMSAVKVYREVPLDISVGLKE